MLNYNVTGMSRLDNIGTDDHKTIAKYIVENEFDIVAAQEDFAYNKTLVNSLKGFDYLTNHAGSILGGDGLSVFIYDICIYNEERKQWDVAFGDIAEGDMSPRKDLFIL